MEDEFRRGVVVQLVNDRFSMGVVVRHIKPVNDRQAPGRPVVAWTTDNLITEHDRSELRVHPDAEKIKKAATLMSLAKVAP